MQRELLLKRVTKPCHAPTEVTRAQVAALSSYGVPHEDIAEFLGVHRLTLTKHYKNELHNGRILANAAVAKRLFKSATKEGNVTAMIFWLKTRAGWRDRVDVTFGLEKLNNTELEQLEVLARKIS